MFPEENRPGPHPFFSESQPEPTSEMGAAIMSGGGGFIHDAPIERLLAGEHIGFEQMREEMLKMTSGQTQGRTATKTIRCIARTGGGGRCTRTQAAWTGASLCAQHVGIVLDLTRAGRDWRGIIHEESQ